MPKKTAAKNLVIVESPTKAKTITKFLSKDYVVIASYGHIRDLPKKDLGIDIEHKFEPSYVIPKDKTKYINEIKKHLGKDTQVWIATDQDREGEAIGWHLLVALKLEKKPIKRIVFHEITKSAILHAIEEPGEINMQLVDAQQARRVLDRLVGYTLSPLLWKKIKYGLSAGRVQSVAVRLIVEREREIQAFKPEEYWSIDADMETAKKKAFTSQLSKFDGKKAELKKEADVKKILKDIEGKDGVIETITKKQKKRSPAAPFTTSTLQQEAHHKCGFTVKRTMTVAQQLYEGIDIGKQGTVGLITYMRTDSTNLAKTALTQAKQVIEAEYGFEYSLDKPRVYKKKAKGAQEAHEAIRPVDLSIHPDDIKGVLSADQFKLYSLIWKRTLASQMKEAKLDATTVEIAVSKAIFKATGQTIKFDGFLRAYLETDHDDEEGKNSPLKEKILPEMKEGDKISVKELKPEQHFTKPPPRYNEASLVKKLESEGIGRPSTYAPTINTIISRGYISRQEKKLIPEEIGFIVNDFLVEHFPDIVDYHFTAEMEEKLDHVAHGEQDWVKLMENFYTPYAKHLEKKEKTIKKGDAIKETTDRKCSECGADMQVKLGRRGKFLACSKYPECKHTESTPEEEAMKKKLREEVGDVKCDKCEKPMVIKNGRFGSFLGCSGYPDCKNIKPIQKDTKIQCPKCKKDTLHEKKTRKGRTFFGCGSYPKCDFATWNLKKEEK